MNQFPSQDLHASAWARRQEQNGQMRQALQQAIDQLTRTLQSAGKFRDLKIAEGLFYAGCRNQQLAGLLQVPENEVGIVKHRLLQRLQQSVRENGGGELCGDTKSATSLLTEVWEERRPGCPKRSTLGRFQLGLLEPDWDDFVQFHVQTLGCTFCVAHLQELDESNSSQADSDIRQRLFQSTVGFLTPKRSAPRC